MMEEKPPAALKTSEDLDTSLNSSLNVSLNQSGYACILNDGVEIGIQTDPAVPDHPKFCVNKRNATEEVKSACAQISSVCGVSVETSRKALQIVCKDLCNHVYLSSKEHAENEGVNKKNPQNMTIIHILYHQLLDLPSSNGCKLQKWKEKLHYFSIKAYWSSLLFILIPWEEVQ